MRVYLHIASAILSQDCKDFNGAISAIDAGLRTVEATEGKVIEDTRAGITGLHSHQTGVNINSALGGFSPPVTCSEEALAHTKWAELVMTVPCLRIYTNVRDVGRGLRRALQLTPQKHRTFFWLAKWYLECREDVKCLDALKECISSGRQNNSDAWTLIGLVYQLNGHAVLSAYAYLTALVLNNKCYDALTNLGVAYETAGQLNDAAECYLRVAQLSPADRRCTHFVYKGLQLQYALKEANPTQHFLPVMRHVTNQTLMVKSTFNCVYYGNLGGPCDEWNVSMRGPGLGYPVPDPSAPAPIVAAAQAPRASSLPDKLDHLDVVNEDIVPKEQGNQSYMFNSKSAPGSILKSKKWSGHNQESHTFNHSGQAAKRAKLARSHNVCETAVISGTQATVSRARVEDSTQQINPDSFQWCSRMPDYICRGVTRSLSAPGTHQPSPVSSNTSLEKSPGKHLHQPCQTSRVLSSNLLRASLNSEGSVQDTKARPGDKHTQTCLSHEVRIIDVTHMTVLELDALETVCIDQGSPVTLLSGMIAGCRIDSSKFTSEALLECNSSHPIEVRTQTESIEDNSDSWACKSVPAQWTVAQYIAYQNKVEPLHHLPGEPGPTLSPGEGSALKPPASSRCSRIGKVAPIPKLKPGEIKFGTNLDLSNRRKWEPQLSELDKLPNYIGLPTPSKVNTDMLSNVGFKILGMNTVQMYLKVRGSRTPAHQENNNFVSGNLSFGPGDCVWYAVDVRYWEKIAAMCDERKLDFLFGSWWPDSDSLRSCGIPVLKFVQKPGDFVFINSGTIHWVESLGRCTNVAWNIGPMTGRQLNMAWNRYTYLRTKSERSLVPMHLLTWKLCELDHLNTELALEVARRLAESLTLQLMISKEIQERGMKVAMLAVDDVPEDCTPCMQCEDEVFNTFFTTPVTTGKAGSHTKKLDVHCFACASADDFFPKGYGVAQVNTVARMQELLVKFIQKYRV